MTVVCLCIQIPTASAAAGNADDDAKGKEIQLTSDITTDSTDSRPFIPVKPDFPPTAGDSRKIPTSSSAWSEEAIQPFSK